MSSFIAALSLLSFVAGQAIEVLPQTMTSYLPGQASATPDAGSGYGQANYAYSGGAAAATTTPAPSATATYDIYSMMPYASMTAGGYQELQCGYGWYKDSSGKCMQQSWVSITQHVLST